jgi:hypothetical protein
VRSDVARGRVPKRRHLGRVFGRFVNPRRAALPTAMPSPPLWRRYRDGQRGILGSQDRDIVADISKKAPALSARSPCRDPSHSCPMTCATRFTGRHWQDFGLGRPQAERVLPWWRTQTLISMVAGEAHHPLASVYESRSPAADMRRGFPVPGTRDQSSSRGRADYGQSCRRL